MIPAILLGGVALWGGYKAKKFLDGKIADDENFYSGYKDAALCEFGKAFVKGTNSLYEKVERWTSEPRNLPLRLKIISANLRAVAES